MQDFLETRSDGMRFFHSRGNMLTHPVRRYFKNPCFRPLPRSFPHMLLNSLLLKHHYGKHPTIHCQCMHPCNRIPGSNASHLRLLHFSWTLQMRLRTRRCCGIQNTSEGGEYKCNPSLMLKLYPVDGSAPHFTVQKASGSPRPF